MKTSPRSPLFPREAGYRQFVQSAGRRHCNPHSHHAAAHAEFEAGWQAAARLCAAPERTASSGVVERKVAAAITWETVGKMLGD